MPPSGRKAKTRARRGAPTAEVHEPSDVDTPEAIATPSRSSRKRARATETAAPAARSTRRKTKDTRQLEREDTEGTEPQDASDNETEPALPGELEVIASLKVADRQVNATEDFANDLLEGQENVPGYGKIAGRDWAFIIRKVEVNIGRPEAHERLQVDETPGQNNGPSHKTVVDIDLGPDRQVSRSHAIIAYDADTASWFIVVNGRNGLRVDNNLLKRGAKTYLRNGSVIEIANTQMAFITTATEDSDGPVWDASIIRQAQKSSEEDDDNFDESRNNGNRANAPPQHRGQLSNTSRLPPEYNTQQQQQQQHRTHPHSHRATALQSMAAPPPGTPLRAVNVIPKSSPLAAYTRGINMESTEAIDYASDGSKDLKPPHSYAQLIGMAILSTHEQQMTLNNIYKWIMSNYAFYRFNTGGWQNSIRHNLSLNKAFTKIARRTDEPGKGMKWMIEPTEFDTFVQQGMKGCRRPPPLPPNGTQTTLASPSSPLHAIRSTPGHTSGVKRNEEDITPPLQPYPAHPSAREAFTPDRGGRRNIDSSVGLGIQDSAIDSTQDAAYSLDYLRSTPRNGMTAAAQAAGSPPQFYMNDEGRVGPMDTPFPLRPTARFAPPSTLRRPSDFIQFSSPAPFWKMEGLVGSTPFKPYDMSPLKTPFPSLKPKVESVEDEKDDKDDLEDEDEEVTGSDDAEAVKSAPSSADGKPAAEQDAKPSRRPSPVVPSSSPPRATSPGRFTGPESPSVSRPTTAGSKGLNLLAAATQQAEQQSGSTRSEQAPASLMPGFSGGPVNNQQQSFSRPSPVLTNGSNGMHGSGYTHAPLPPHPGQPMHHPQQQQQLQNGYTIMPANAQDDDDEGIDLAKGFQPIGVFHQSQRSHNHMPLGMNGLGSQPLGVGGPRGSFGR